MKSASSLFRTSYVTDFDRLFLTLEIVQNGFITINEYFDLTG